MTMHLTPEEILPLIVGKEDADRIITEADNRARERSIAAWSVFEKGPRHSGPLRIRTGLDAKPSK